MPAFSLLPWGLAVLFLAFHCARGWQLSGAGWGGWRDVAAAPAYALWKLSLPFRGRRAAPGAWVRTSRKGETP